MQKILRFRFGIRFLLALVMLVAILLASRDTLLCNYHQWALRHADSAPSSWLVGSFERHIKELARLGRYENRKFVLKRMTVDSVEARRLFTRLRSVRGADAWLTMGRYSGDSDTLVADNITVICAPKKMYVYQYLIETADAAFVPKRDQPLGNVGQERRPKRQAIQ